MADDQDDLGALLDALARGRPLDVDVFQRLFPPDFAHRTLTRVEQLRAMLAEREAVDPRFDPGDTLIDQPDGDPDYPLLTPLGQHPRYGLGELLGAGGVAEVYVALDRRLGRSVALKALRPEVGEQRRNRQRFVAESQTTARLAHPGIIPVHDAGKLADGRLFFTMRRVQGRTLRDVVDALRDGDPITAGQFPAPRLVSIFQRVCMTVAYAHDQGIIHRDLKPENILIGTYGEVYVADWGLSRPFDEEADPEDRLTREGEAIGTLYYMAPEQACGELEDQGPGIDVWALGVILYELLSLERPFVGRSIINLVYVIATDPPRPIREVTPPERALPDALVELIDEALIKEVAERTLTAKGMADRISAWLDGIEADRRRKSQATARLAEARAEAGRFRAAYAEAEQADAAVRAERVLLAGDAPESARMALWSRARQSELARLEAERQRVAAIDLAMQAIETWETDEAHQLVADLSWHRAEALRRQGDPVAAVPFETLARRHDRGRLADRLAPGGRLEIAHGGAAIRILAQIPMGPLRVDRPIEAADGRLPTGSYVIEARGAGRLAARVPVCVQGNGIHRVRIRPPADSVGPSWVYVQGADAELGGDPDAPRALPPTRVRIDPLLIGRHPITVAEYRAFLDALAERDPDAAARHTPRFEARGADAGRQPVVGVDLAAARAYCRWRSLRDGAEVRLPTEHEWEYAARGADGRRFPWGDGFDPALCRMAAGSGEGPGPVGGHLRDRSPFGVIDLAGRVREWTASPADAGAGRFVLRGGSHRDPAPACRAAARRFANADTADDATGFRVVRALAPPNAAADRAR